MSSFPDFIFHRFFIFILSLLSSDIISFYDFTRVGGVFTHVAKTFPITPSPLQSSNISMDVELFDDIVLLYHLAAVQVKGTLLLI